MWLPGLSHLDTAAPQETKQCRKSSKKTNLKIIIESERDRTPPNKLSHPARGTQWQLEWKYTAVADSNTNRDMYPGTKHCDSNSAKQRKLLLCTELSSCRSPRKADQDT